MTKHISILAAINYHEGFADHCEALRNACGQFPTDTELRHALERAETVYHKLVGIAVEDRFVVRERIDESLRRQKNG